MMSGVCVGIIVARRLLVVDGCWSRAQRSLVSERTEGETSNFWKLRPTTSFRYHLLEEAVHLSDFAQRMCSLY